MIYKKTILFVIFLITIPLILASSLDILTYPLSMSGITNTQAIGSFQIKNNGNSNINNITFYVSDLINTPNNNYIIQDSDITINSGNTLNLMPQQTATINVIINIPSNIPQGTYIGIISASNNSEEDTTLLILNVIQQDTTAPIVLSHSPTGTLSTSSFTFTVTTSENATCKYSTSQGTPYNNMLYIFDITGTTTHSKFITGLTDNTYHYYVRCIDNYGNVALSDYDASFTVDSTPKAQITLSDPSPVKAGTIYVTLTVSENLQQTPILKYTLDGSTEIYIPLTGSNNLWNGYMIIDETTGNKVGSFIFSGTDIEGNTGNTITSGGIFIVDTIKPPKIASLDTYNLDNNIKLEWYYNEEFDYFKIYRSTNPGVDYTDFYDTAYNTTLTDTSVTGGKKYYYKITAVDEAGNEADLSPEIFATALLNGVTPTETESGLDLELIGDVDSLINTVNTVTNDADYAKYYLESQDSLDSLIQDLSLIDKIDSGKSELNKIISDLEDIKSQDLSSVELDKKLKRIELQIKTIKNSIPDSISISEEKEITQVLSLNDIMNLVDDVYLNLDDNKRDDFIKKNENLIDKLSVKVKAKLVNIGYLDGSEKEITFIEKEILSNTLNNNLSLIEIIPKTIADDVNKIEFKNTNYEILKSDPVVKWKSNNIFDGNNAQLKYIIENTISLDDIVGIKSLLIEDSEEEESKNLLSGFASLNIKTDSSIIIGVIVIIALITYYFFFVKRIKINLKKFVKEKDDSFSNLIKETDNYIKKGILMKAKENYEIITSYYKEKSPTFNDKDRESLHKKISEIGNKLNLLYIKKEINKANRLLLKNKKEKALSVFNKIKLIYSKLDADLKLRFRNDYNSLYKKFN